MALIIVGISVHPVMPPCCNHHKTVSASNCGRISEPQPPATAYRMEPMPEMWKSGAPL